MPEGIHYEAGEASRIPALRDPRLPHHWKCPTGEVGIIDSHGFGIKWSCPIHWAFPHVGCLINQATANTEATGVRYPAQHGYCEN